MKIGFVGLGKMGLEMATRLVNAGHAVVGYDLSQENAAKAAGRGVQLAADLAQLCQQLEAPRVVWVQAPPGNATGSIVEQLAGLLAQGDVVVDGGNSDFRDSLRRAAQLRQAGVQFVDAGVSGGVQGAREGCGLLVGASEAQFRALEPVFQALAAPGGYVRAGDTGAGHFAKMVHNGVEYAIMEAYAEGYELMCRSELNLDVLTTLQAWQNGCSVRSLLLEKLIEALQPDDRLDGVVGYVADSGMGRWTVEEAIRLKVPTPAISAALQARFRSQQQESPAMQSIAALRGTIGGHPVQRKG